MNLKKKLVGLAVVGTTLAAALLPGAAFAASDKHATPGTPGDPKCEGQAMAYLAQAVKNLGVEGVQPGVGNLAKYAELSMQEIRTIVEEYCATV